MVEIPLSFGVTILTAGIAASGSSRRSLEHGALLGDNRSPIHPASISILNDHQ
jgi:hypothetical protein